MTKEFLTGFQVEFPALLGLSGYPDGFFVGFNLFWIAVWVLAAGFLRRSPTLAYFPVWFFALGMILNGIAHPLLALYTGGYFPGLVSSPFVGVAGFIVMGRLIEFSE